MLRWGQWIGKWQSCVGRLTAVATSLDAAVFIFSVSPLDRVDDQAGQVAVKLFFQSGFFDCFLGRTTDLTL